MREKHKRDKQRNRKTDRSESGVIEGKRKREAERLGRERERETDRQTEGERDKEREVYQTGSESSP